MFFITEHYNDPLSALEMSGSMAFMASGSISGIQKRMNIGGIIVMSFITGILGGTLRDLCQDKTIFWLFDNCYLIASCLIGVFTLYLYYIFRKFIGPDFLRISQDILDAIGISAFMASTGIMSVCQQEPILISFLSCSITCLGGGMIRDILCNRQPSCLYKDFYVGSVVLGNVILLGLLPRSLPLSVVSSVSVVFLVRMICIFSEILKGKDGEMLLGKKHDV